MQEPISLINAIKILLVVAGVGLVHAEQLAPWAVALLCSLIGAFLALMRREDGDQRSNLAALALVLGHTVFAFAIALSLALWVSHAFTWARWEWSLPIIAIVCAYTGPTRIITWARETLLGWLERKAGGR